LKSTLAIPKALAAADMQKPLRLRAMIFNATAIASFTPQHFGAWFTKHKSF
jgi:hypothetical protein